MWPPPVNHGERMPPLPRLFAVAIDRDKNSQIALKWAVDNLIVKGQTVILIHVKLKQSVPGLPAPPSFATPWPNQISEASDEIGDDIQLRELLVPFHVFCMRKDIQCYDVVVDDTDVAGAIIEFVKQSTIDVLVLGAGKGSIFRFKTKDIPGNILKGVPDFCTVFVIHKGKISSTRAASRPTPSILNPLRNQILIQAHRKSNASEPPVSSNSDSRSSFSVHSRPGSELPIHAKQNEANFIKSPFTHRKAPTGKAYEVSPPETDISFVSSARQSLDVFPSYYERSEGAPTPPRLSGISDIDYPGFNSLQIERKSVDTATPPELFLDSIENDKAITAQTMEEVEAEMRRLKQELKQTMDLYSTACKEALSAKEKAKELQRWKIEEQKRLEEARLSEEAALALAKKEKAKSRAAFEHAEASRRIVELEAQKRINAEMVIKESEDESRVLDALTQSDSMYRKYTIEEIEAATEYFAQSRKIGEGGYGPVYKCYLDHTPAAVKVLRPDATHGRSQFQQEVEILSCIRHPHMVLLLGACPEYGCLVYEYMSNGSLEDRLLRHGNTPPLSWQHRFRIAAEIGTGLLFLHQTKPEPLVHRDLKPANILLDRNYVSKISDVGLARLVPPSTSDCVTQYRMTSTAGTFCYIDPEYQQTGMLGVKSDIYSLGIIFLQILTGKSPMGLTHHVERAIERGAFPEMLDPSVPDWPVEEALSLAKLALKCSELGRKDRPDLGKVVLPQLNKLRELAEDAMANSVPCSTNPSPTHSQVSMSKEDLSYPPSPQSSMGS
ncbi:U-box domain-containing protein 35-like [Primulina huaijiensis]|uniref:U-box domain-containing protein 35-like n=1 Tax=Primulina huaijiensis TaxID=1492673 RepID=UPI003CC79A90